VAHSGAGHYLQSSIPNYFSEHYLWQSKLIRGFSSSAFVRICASNARRVIDAKYGIVTWLLHEKNSQRNFTPAILTVTELSQITKVEYESEILRISYLSLLKSLDAGNLRIYFNFNSINEFLIMHPFIIWDSFTAVERAW